MVILAVLLIILNLLGWLMFLKNFKRLFTTDNVINNAKSEINRIVIDLNGNTERNINLIDDRINRLRTIVAEAEKKIKLLEESEKRSVLAKDLRARVGGVSHEMPERLPVRTPADAYLKNSMQRTAESAASGSMATVSPTQMAPSSEKAALSELFIQGDAAVPVPSVSVVPLKKTVKKDMKESIVSLFDMGFMIDEIAAKLGCSTTEVQFVLTIESRM